MNNRYIISPDKKDNVLLDVQPYLVAQEELTNHCLDNEDMTSGNWDYNIPAAEVELLPSNKHAWSLTKTTTSNIHALQSITTLVGKTVIVKVVLKKTNVDTGYWHGIDTYIKDTGFVGAHWLAINPYDGDFTIGTQDGSTGVLEPETSVVLVGDFWFITIVRATLAVNTEVIVGIGVDLYKYPDFSANNTDITNNKVIFGMSQVYEYTGNLLSNVWVPTATATTTGPLKPTFPSENHSNSEGPYYGEIDWMGGDTKIMSIGANDMLLIEDIAGDKVLTLTDQTNTVSLPILPVGKHNFGVLFAEGEMQLMLDNTYSLKVPYTNSFGTGDIILGENIRNFNRFDRTTLVDQKIMLEDGFMLLSDGTMYEPSDEYGIDDTIMTTNWDTPPSGITVSGKLAIFDGTQGVGATVAINSGTLYTGLHIANIRISNTTVGGVRFGSLGDFLTDGIYNVHTLPDNNTLVVEEDGGYTGTIEVLEVYPVLQGLLYNNVTSDDWSKDI